MSLLTLESDGAPLTPAEAYENLYIPILERITDHDLPYNWMLETRQQSPPPAPPSSPETREGSLSRSIGAHSPPGRKPLPALHHLTKPHRNPICKDDLNPMAVFTDPPPSYNDYASMIHTHHGNPNSGDDDAATKTDLSSPTQSFSSDSDTTLSHPTNPSPYPTPTWNATKQSQHLPHPPPKSWSFFPKPSTHDPPPRRPYHPLPSPSPSARPHKSSPASPAAPPLNPTAPDPTASRANSWPRSHAGKPKPGSGPPPDEEKSGWFPDDEDDEKEKQKQKQGRRKSLGRRLRRAFSCGSGGSR